MERIFTATILFLVMIFANCKDARYSELPVPNEYAGFIVRDKKTIKFYSDRMFQNVHSEMPTQPKRFAYPMRQRYKIHDRNEIGIELADSSGTFFVKENDIYYNYASCAKFDNIEISSLENLRGLRYRDKLLPKSSQSRGHGGSLLPKLKGSSEEFSYGNTGLRIGNTDFLVHTIEKKIAFCEDGKSIAEIIDYVALTEDESLKTKQTNLCEHGSILKGEIYIFVSDGKWDSQGFYNIEKAWEFDLAALKLKPAKTTGVKCLNECASGCEP